MPLYEKLNFPASAMLLTKEFIKIGTFDLIPTDWLNDLIWYFPDEDPFSLNFETLGIASKHLLQNIGLILYLILANILYAILYLLVVPCRRSLGNFGQNTVKKMEGYLLFNGSIRFCMEIFFDVLLIASLNLHTIEWDSPFIAVQVSNYLSIALLALICLWPLCTLLVTCTQPSIWTNKRF